MCLTDFWRVCAGTGWASPGDHTDGSAVSAKEVPVEEVVNYGSIGHAECERVETKIPRGGSSITEPRLGTPGQQPVACLGSGQMGSYESSSPG